MSLAAAYSDTSDYEDPAASEMDPHFTASAFPVPSLDLLHKTANGRSGKKKGKRKGSSMRPRASSREGACESPCSSPLMMTTDTEEARKQQEQPWLAPLDDLRQQVSFKDSQLEILLQGVELTVQADRDRLEALAGQVGGLDLAALRNEVGALRDEVALKNQECDDLRSDVEDLETRLERSEQQSDAIGARQTMIEAKLEPITNGSCNLLAKYLKYKHKFLEIRDQMGELQKSD